MFMQKKSVAAIIIHGGAWNIPKNLRNPSKYGVEAAAMVGWEILSWGGSALDAVTEACVVMEDNPAFDAGTGSVLNSDGYIEMDALIMNGRDLNAGSVAGIRKVKNPIRVARAVMGTAPHVMLVGEGATRFARSVGIPEYSESKLVIDREYKRWEKEKRMRKFQVRRCFTKKGMDIHDTVGAVAIDVNGDLAAATTTGGTPFKLPGRVGDSALVGSGAYADNELGAASATGLGETILKVVLCKAACDLLKKNSAKKSANMAINILREKADGLGGLIMIDRRGNIAFNFNTPYMPHAYMKTGMKKPAVGI